jgi:hypothetical protein
MTLILRIGFSLIALSAITVIVLLMGMAYSDMWFPIWVAMVCIFSGCTVILCYFVYCILIDG